MQNNTNNWPRWWRDFVYREPPPTNEPTEEQRCKEEAARAEWNRLAGGADDDRGAGD